MSSHFQFSPRPAPLTLENKNLRLSWRQLNGEIKVGSQSARSNLRSIQNRSKRCGFDLSSIIIKEISLLGLIFNIVLS